MGLFDGCRRHCCPSLCFRPKADDVSALDFSHHCLEDVPNSVFAHERTLEELDLDSNQIRDLPRALFHCEGLRRLNLSDNELQSIPSAVSSLTKLQELNISKNHILQIPDGIKSCKCLTVVDASVNPLGPRLPDSFTQLINLEELYLNDAFLEFLPANFGRLSRLKVVELRENHLKLLPKSMSRLVELTRLDIGQNDFLEFPEVIGSLQKLSELWCDCNRIISVPASIGNLKNLTYLDISYNRVEELASEIGECHALTDLTFTSNNLTELPESIGNLTNLTVLRIDENEIKFLPTTLGSLQSLEELVFNGNEIETIPSNIGLLRNLQIMIGDCNRLTALPLSIGSCLNLRILSLASNHLKVIPDDIGRLTSLRVINLNSNQLSYLPISLTKITNLQALWLSENQTKPLVQFQSDIDKQSNQKVLTCFLLPQIPVELNESHSPKDNKNNNNNDSTIDKQIIKFSNNSTSFDIVDDDIDDHITSKLIRAPTPYPKELKAHARHARNLALKKKEANSSEVVSNDTNNLETEPLSARIQIREAKVSKSSDVTDEAADVVKRPTTLPVNQCYKGNDNGISQKNALSSSHLEQVASRISEILLKSSEYDNEVTEDKNAKHERKSSYKVAVNNSSTAMKSPIERRIKSRIHSSNSESERGYRSDIETYSADKSSFDSIPGYSSDCELTSKRMNRLNKSVPKEFESDSALIQMPYNSHNKSNINANKNMKVIEMRDNMKNTSNVKAVNETVRHIQNTNNSHTYEDKRKAATIAVQSADKPIDVNSNSSYPSSASERPVSVCSTRSQNNNGNVSNGSSNTSQCSLSRNDLISAESNSQTPALPLNPIKNTLKSDSGLGIGIARQKPQTASSQFIFQKFSQFHSQPKPLIGHNSSQVFSPQDIDSKNKNGIKFIDESQDSNGSEASNTSLNKTNISSLSNRYISNDAHVFPVIIVKNPGLGFSIDCGIFSNRLSDSMVCENANKGIYVSSVEPAGSASTALKVGDRILQINGIDLQNATKDKANHLFESTGNTISLMVSRDKS